MEINYFHFSAIFNSPKVMFVRLMKEDAGQLMAYEFKWTNRKSNKIPSTFLSAYVADQRIIDCSNFRELFMQL